MTERLADVEARIGTAHQLSAVIAAMRGIAAARSREARTRLEGIRAYAEGIGQAIGTALAFLPGPAAAPPEMPDGHAVIALCAEQGFAGTFSERVLDAAAPLLAGGAELMLVGDRGLLVAGERKLVPGWSAPMVAHVGQAAALANRLAEALYQRLDQGRIRRVSVVHAVPGGSAVSIVVETLVPFDFGRFPLRPHSQPPRLTLAPGRLLARLAEEYVFAELCEAVVLSFAAENEARMRAMIAARGSVAETLRGLTARARQLRQEEITNEIVELASGAAAGR